MTAIFVTGSHTDVGKTHVACALLVAAHARGLSVEAFKPLVSGFDPDDWSQSDPGRLITALGQPLTPAALEAMSPVRLTAPLSPPMAARLEARRLDLAEIVRSCQARLGTPADLLVIEGVGGVMSPITEDATGLDLMGALRLPAVLVGGAYLGAISHTLTALEVIRARGLPLAAVVVSQNADGPDFGETVESVRTFAHGVPVVAAPREGGTWTGQVLDLLP
jgi:dethiobiotin synthetase